MSSAVRAVAAIAFAAACVGSVRGAEPRVWTSLSGVRSVADFERTADDLVAHGVEVAQAGPWWSDEIRAAALRICRAKGLKLYLEIHEGSRCDRAKPKNLKRELAVMIGGCYKGLAIDRHLYAFTPEKHRIVIEPPVYSKAQAYLKYPHYMMQGDGHYYGQYVPTGRAEIVVPEKLFDGRQHLKIIPATVKRAPQDAVVENDTVVSGKLQPTKDMRERHLVELEFDLTGLGACRLDKVGIAVYWRMEAENPVFNPMRGCYSLFAASTRAALRGFAEEEVERWKKANGGMFPSDVIIAARLGDEVFNHTGWLNSEAVSLPLWGFSESALKVYGKAFGDGETYPRTWGAGEVYGEDCAAKFLYVFHEAAVRYLRETVDYLHGVGVKSFRNTTRGDPWSYANDHDGTGQEVLARALDYLHLDPYPYHGSYAEEVIPFDCAYLKGLSRRYAKPMIVWMQAHQFGPGGLMHPDPATVSRMYDQVKRHDPESIMWLGYCADEKNGGATYPFRRPDSWTRAGEIHADFRRTPAKPGTRPPLAVVRPYRERAAVANPQGADRNAPDVLLGSFVRRWACRHDLPYDIFEVPPDAFRSKADVRRLADELKGYRFVVSSADFPGATNIAAAKDGKPADRTSVWRLADELAARATDFEDLRRKAVDRKRLIIWDDDGCDMTHYPFQRRDLAKEPASVRNFEQVFLEATEGTKADVIGYSGVMGFGYFTALKSGADVNTNRFAGAHEPWRNAVNEFAAMGHDAMEMAVAHAHRNGKECFFSLRFNDNHDNGDPDIMLSPFKRQNPEVMVGHERKIKCCGRFAADFAQEKVRTFVKKYIRGYLENYDLDGIEYDFFRHPQLFRTVALGGHATSGELEIMTALMKDLRAIAEEVGRKRGRPFVLCARVPDSVDYCKAIGIDLERWAKEGVIDFLVVGGYFQLEPWRKTADLVHGWGLKCYASIDESRIERVRGVKFLPGRDSKECWLARVAAAMASGMDGVNLFNIEYFDHQDQKWIMGYDIRQLDGVEKLYFATYTGGGGYWPYNFLVGGDSYWKTSGLNPARPVKLSAGGSHSFELVLGDDPAVWRKVHEKELTATLKLLADVKSATDIAKVEINGTTVPLGVPEGGVFTAIVPSSTLKRGANAVRIVAAGEVTLHDFSLRVTSCVQRRAAGIGPVIYNTDGCDMLDYPVGDPITYDGFIAQRLARDIPGSSVTAVGYCPVSSGFGFFTALKMGDTFLNPLPPGSKWRGRKVYNATGDFAKQGLDALEMGLRYSRSQGCAAIVTLRMNDTHDQDHTPEKPSFIFSPFKRKHPECLMGTHDRRPPFCSWSAVDYTQPLVREAMVGYVRQLCENYDFDALDLDFFRHVQYFKSVAWGAESASDAERAMLTDVVRDIRMRLRALEQKKGRRLYLTARTPDSAAYCRAAGIDIETWMRDGLIDGWCGGGYFRLSPWRDSVELAHRYGVRFYASLDESRVERHCARLKLPRFDGRNSSAHFAAQVAVAAEEGCDGIEFFNIDDYPDSERLAISRLTPGRTDGLDKDYFLVDRGSGGYMVEGFLKNGLRFRKRPPVDPGRGDCPRLKPNEPYAFEMTVADDFAGLSKAAKVTAEVLIQPTVAKNALPVLTVNGKDVGAPAVPKKDVITYTIPVSALKRGANAFSVKVPAGGEFRDFVLRVRH